MLECLDAPGRSTSPFDRLIAFDVYDGPITGIAFCRESDDVALFRLLAWDNRLEHRVFELSPVHRTRAAGLVRTLEDTQAAHWPEWWLKHFSNEADRVKVDAEIATMIAESLAPSHIVVSKNLLAEATDTLSLNSVERMEAYRRLNVRSSSDAEVTQTPFDEWLIFIKTNTAVIN